MKILKFLERVISITNVLGILVALGAVWLLAASPIHTVAQAYVGFGLLFVMFALLYIGRRIDFQGPLIPIMRILCIFIAIFLTARYLVWRIEFTIGGYGTISLIAGLALFAAELYSAGFALLGYFVNLNPRERKPVPLPTDESIYPTVDVVVPTYNEPAELLEVTLLGALDMQYPAQKLAVHLLDDGGTDDRCRKPGIAEQSLARRKELQALCARVGAIYHTRQHNDHAKAGNINAALPDLNGDLMVILDADHVPTRDFLRRTVGFFLKDPKCFLVQTPHSFINPDPIEKNLGIQHDCPPETELFHNVIQTGLDGWNASFFCGSAAVMRRSMLMEVGGIQGDTITEDAETAMILHARGYNSVFLNESLTVGLQPETVMSFIAQRVRWATGALQLLHFKNPLKLRGLSPTQRIAYLSSFSYWFFPFSRLITILAPSAFLLFGIMVYNATTEQYAIYGIPYFLSTMIFSDFIFGKIRWPLISDVYEMVQTPLAAPALAATILRPGKPSFKVTPKGEQLDRDFLAPTAWIQYGLLLVVLGSLIAGGLRWWYHPGERPQLVFTMMWEFINFIIVAAAVGVTFERKQRRQDFRVRPTAPVPAIVQTASGERASVRIEDLSVGGAALRWLDKDIRAQDIRTDDQALLWLESGRTAGQVFFVPIAVVKGGSGYIHIRFQYASLNQKAEVVALMYGDRTELERRLNRRRKRVSFLTAYRYLGDKAMAGLWRNMGFVMRSIIGFPRQVVRSAAHRRGSYNEDLMAAEKSGS